MRTKRLMKFVVSVAIVALIGSCRWIERIGPIARQRIVFEAELSDDMLVQAAKLRVYELQPAGVNRRTFEGRAKRLFGDELKGSVVQANGVISVVDTEKESHFMMLELNTGYLSFNRGMADQIDDKPNNLPSDEKAVQIAQDFLRDNDLGPGNTKEMFLARVGHIRSATFDPKTGKEGPVRNQMQTVHFARKLDDVPVMGSGSKIIVRIGDGGKVVGGARRWSEIGRSRGLEKKNLSSVSRLKKGIRTFLNNEMDEFERIEIVQFIIAYYDNGGKYIQPVLAYEAKVIGKELSYAYLGQIALLHKPPERVGPEPVPREAMRSLKRPSLDEKPPVRKPD
jgi:hypothetical protein